MDNFLSFNDSTTEAGNISFNSSRGTYQNEYHQISLHDYMAKKKINDIEDLNVHLERVPLYGTARLHFFKAQTDDKRTLSQIKKETFSVEVIATDWDGIEKMDPQRKRNLHALFSLNLANIVSKIENDTELPVTFILNI